MELAQDHVIFWRRNCPDVRNWNMASELLTALVAPCRYDQWAPPGNKSGPLQVGVRMHVYFLGAIEAQSLVSGVTHCTYSLRHSLLPSLNNCQIGGRHRRTVTNVDLLLGGPGLEYRSGDQLP
jgi:hypothetical protein